MYSCSWNRILQLRGVTCHQKQVNTPHLNPSQTCSGYHLPALRDRRLSWPRWPVTYRYGLPTRKRCKQWGIKEFRNLLVLAGMCSKVLAWRRRSVTDESRSSGSRYCKHSRHAMDVCGAFLRDCVHGLEQNTFVLGLNVETSCLWRWQRDMRKWLYACSSVC